MQDDDQPIAKFQRFERVLMTDREGKHHTGTILWRDLVQYRQFVPPGFQGTPERWARWEYAVNLPDFGCCPTLEEDRLEPTGEFDAEGAHRARRYEISFDTGLDDDDLVVEGSFRVRGEFWQVFVFEKKKVRGESISELRHRFVDWESGISGVVFDVPSETTLDKHYIIRAFAIVFGTDDWVEVRGPDSLLLK
jgi:hypothetical protein